METATVKLTEEEFEELDEILGKRLQSAMEFKLIIGGMMANDGSMPSSRDDTRATFTDYLQMLSNLRNKLWDAHDGLLKKKREQRREK